MAIRRPSVFGQPRQTRFLLQRLAATPPNDDKDNHYRQRTGHNSDQRYSIHQFAPLSSI
jgi:hypothetical protein